MTTDLHYLVILFHNTEPILCLQHKRRTIVSICSPLPPHTTIVRLVKLLFILIIFYCSLFVAFSTDAAVVVMSIMRYMK